MVISLSRWIYTTVIGGLLFERISMGLQILINLVYGMFSLGLRKGPKTEPDHVAFLFIFCR